MKTQNKLLIFAFIIATFNLTGCEDSPNQGIDDNLKATFISAETDNGFTEGEIDQTIDIHVTFNHPVPDLVINNVEKIVIDNHTTEYIIVATESEKNDVFDSITVSYDIVEAGTHELRFYYRIEGMERQFLADFGFAINQ